MTRISRPHERPLAPSDPLEVSERQTVRAAIAAVRGGDAEAFATVVEIYRRRIFGLVLMTTRDRDAAEDVMQQSFIRAYTNLARYDQRRDFHPWLATIAIRLAQNWLKRQGRTAAREHTGTPLEHEDTTTPDLLGGLIEDENARRLWLAVAALPQGERMAVLLHYREEMKIGEVAGALGVTEGTVKTLLFRGRRKLRNMMAGTAVPHEQEQTQ